MNAVIKPPPNEILQLTYSLHFALSAVTQKLRNTYATHQNANKHMLYKFPTLF